MSNTDELKKTVSEAINQNREQAIGIARKILEGPETGFKEHKTSKLVQEALSGMGLEFESGIAITGVKAVLDGTKPGPTVAVMGELDSVVCSGHPHADPETGAAHACGHHTQIGQLIAVAQALSSSGVMEHLAGRVALIAVPAEEYIEIESRMEMRAEGKLEFLGGKPEFVRLGAFDDIDLAMMTHTTTDPDAGQLGVGATFNGMVAIEAEFIGRAAHAGACPWDGINALNAASLALAAINANRETFQEKDTVRVHPIITRGGEIVNVVPANVRMEMFVRGKTIQAITDTCVKVERCLKAGALAVGGEVKITTVPGYLPYDPHPCFENLYRSNAEATVGTDNTGALGHCAASTDMSDLSQIMPTIHPYVGGVTGVVHGNDYLVCDWDLAVTKAAETMALTVIDLLTDDAKTARSIVAESKPKLTRQQYLDLVRGYFKEETFRAVD